MIKEATTTYLATRIAKRESTQIHDGKWVTWEVEYELGYNTTADVDIDGSLDILDAFLAQKCSDSINEKLATQLATPPATVATGFQPPAQEGFPLPAQEEAEPMAVVKFSFEKTKDGKYKLGLFEMIQKKTGLAVGEWPTIWYTAEQVPMWNMIQETIGTDFQASLRELPLEQDCSYWADWKHGRQKKDSDKRYQDLVALRPR